MDDLAAFVTARLDEYRDSPDRLDFTSLQHLAACWRKHPDYRPEWAPE